MVGRLPSRLGAAVLSALFPGAGQLYAGHRRRGLVLIAVTTMLVLPALVAAVVVLGPWEVSGTGLAVDLIRPFFEHPGLAIVLLVAVIVTFVFRVYAVVDAFRLGHRSGGRGRRLTEAVVLAWILGLVLWPHVWATEQALALHSLVTTDFATDPGQTAAPTTTTTTVPEPPPIPETETGTAPPETAGVATTAAAPPTTQPDPFAGEDRINVVLLGGDAGPGRSGIRTDTIIVVSIEPATGRTALFSIPRNQAQWPIPRDLPAVSEWECGCFPHPTNTIYAFGLAHPELFPGGQNTGGNAVKAILGEGLGIEIDYFALVDLVGFIELVDAFGGIDIHVTKPVYDPGHEHPDGTTTDVWVPIGDHHFDGKTALAYVRARRQDSDYHRMDRQRCVLEAIADEADPLTLLRRFAKVGRIIEENLHTDIPVSRFPDFMELFRIVDTDSIISLRFMPYAPELAGTGASYTAGTDGLGYWRPNLDLIRSTVRTALESEPYDALAELNLESLEDVCEGG